MLAVQMLVGRYISNESWLSRNEEDGLECHPDRPVTHLFKKKKKAEEGGRSTESVKCVESLDTADEDWAKGSILLDQI